MRLCVFSVPTPNAVLFTRHHHVEAIRYMTQSLAMMYPFAYEERKFDANAMYLCSIKLCRNPPILFNNASPDPKCNHARFEFEPLMNIAWLERWFLLVSSNQGRDLQVRLW
jgi:hypothetical protein